MFKNIPLPQEARNISIPTKSVFLQHNDARAILWLAQRTKGTIVEVGCNVGYTTKQIATRFPRRRIVGIDWSGESNMHSGQCHEHLKSEDIGREAKGLKNVTVIDCDSKGIDYSAIGDVGFVFIDGDHTDTGVAADSQLALAINPRPIIAWHDVSENHPDWVGVMRYLKKISDNLDIAWFDETWVAYTI